MKGAATVGLSLILGVVATLAVTVGAGGVPPDDGCPMMSMDALDDDRITSGDMLAGVKTTAQFIADNPGGVCQTETPSSSVTPSPSPTNSPTPTENGSVTTSPSASWTASPTNSPSPTASPSRTPTIPPTSTRTATASPTRTPTSASTATPTPSSGYTVADLLEDTTGDHEGTLCSSVNGYSWAEQGRVGDAQPQQGDTNFKAWGTSQWAACGDDSPGGNYLVRNLKVMALKTTGMWHTYSGPNPFNWCYNHEVNTADSNAPCTGVSGGWVQASGQQSLHWATQSQALTSNIRCHVVIYEARATNGAQIMANTGFDWYQGAEGYDGDSWFGSYRLLPTDGSWRKIGGTSCTSSQLNTNPPTL